MIIILYTFITINNHFDYDYTNKDEGDDLSPTFIFCT